jgi:hypothetical protein
MDGWEIPAIANGVVSVVYLSIGWHILRRVHLARSWSGNPLAIATGLIFLTCAVGHFGHLLHLVHPETREVSAQLYDWHLALIDTVTGVIAIRYWLLRSRFPALVRGAAIFEDLTERRHQALTIHDEVVQQLATAKLAFELGEAQQGMQALDRGLASSRNIVTMLVGDEIASTAAMRGGGLRRSPSG